MEAYAESVCMYVWSFMQWPHVWRSTCRSSSESGKAGGRGPREQPKSDLMGKRGSSWGRRGRPSQGTKREISAACDAGGLGRSEAVYRGGGPEAIRIKLFSKVPPAARAYGC